MTQQHPTIEPTIDPTADTTTDPTIDPSAVPTSDPTFASCVQSVILFDFTSKNGDFGPCHFLQISQFGQKSFFAYFPI